MSRIHLDIGTVDALTSNAAVSRHASKSGVNFMVFTFQKIKKIWPELGVTHGGEAPLRPAAGISSANRLRNVRFAVPADLAHRLQAVPFRNDTPRTLTVPPSGGSFEAI
jgi:hypothetical protein